MKMSEYHIYKKVQSYIAENKLIEPNMTVFIGFSGGADSMAMTDLLQRYQSLVPFKIVVVHVHHGIRGEEADHDRKIAEEFCRRRELPLRLYYYNVPAVAKEKNTGIEEAGRICREAAFQQLIHESEKGNRCRIALAHNKNDLAETMLHHLSRGTGLHGLAGIFPANGQKIRPVLCLERSEIETYCEERGLLYVTDSSNQEDEYTRNRIRHHILPALIREVNSETISHLAETAQQILEADAFVEQQADLLLARQNRRESGYLFLNDMQKEAHILQSYAILKAMKELSGRQKDFTSVHVRDVESLWMKQVSREVSLPENLKAVRTYEGILLYQAGEKTEQFNRKYILNLSEKQEIPIGDGRISTDIFEYHGEKIPENEYTKWIDYDKIEGELVVRTRQSEDYLILDATGKRKKLNRYFIDGKIPANERNSIPLIASGSEILWVIGKRLNANYKVSDKTTNVLQITYKRGENS